MLNVVIPLAYLCVTECKIHEGNYPNWHAEAYSTLKKMLNIALYTVFTSGIKCIVTDKVSMVASGLAGCSSGKQTIRNPLTG